MIQVSPIEKKQHKNLITTWAITLLVLFPVFIILGLLMRMHQGEMIEFEPGSYTFYAFMTMHGLGMAGILFSFAAAALFYLIGTKYARLSVKFGWFLYALFMYGALGLLYGTLVLQFAGGWYLLYPLPFIQGMGGLGATIVSLIILGVCWLLQSMQIVIGISKEYGGLSKLFAWDYIFNKTEPDRKMPPIVLIATVSLVPGILAYIAGAVVLIMYLMQFLNPDLYYDPLLVKNLLFFFGHMIVNITLYCGVGWVYTILPKFTGREWTVNRITAIAWNATFLFIVFAYFHHLYMDFAQPKGAQFVGQVASYLSPLPATAVSMFGVIAQLYRTKMKWTIIPLTFLLGCMGWAIGGFAAVVDSTIAMNKVLHGTLWVPAHFHTYMLLGAVLFILGFVFYLAYLNRDKQDLKPGIGFWLFVIGAAGFLLMFYLGGMESVPRRYSEYSHLMETTHNAGKTYAQIAVYFVSAVLLGLFIMYFRLIGGLLKKTPETTEVEA